MRPLVKLSLRNGALAGIIGWVLLILLFYMGRHPVLIPVFMDFRIILFGVFIFFTLREIRDYYGNGILYFSQGIASSFLFTVCYAFLSSLLLLAFMRVEPRYLSEYVSLQTRLLKALPTAEVERIGKDVYDKNLQMLPATDNLDLAQLYFAQSFLISLFISIILSVILRRQPKS